jgi:hypothetical protein
MRQICSVLRRPAALQWQCVRLPQPVSRPMPYQGPGKQR